MNDNLPDEKEYKKYNYKLTPFKLCVLQNFPFIEADFDAITNYQLLCKVVEYLNHVIDNQNTVEDNFKIMADNLNTLYNYIDTLDLQDEVNNKLDQMAESGELTEIISLYLNTKAIFAYNNINELKQATNLVNGSIVKTLGFYNINDGGGALYKIRTITNDDIVDNMFIIELLDNELIAELVINNIYKPECLGAKNDGTTDCSLIFNTIFNKMQNNSKLILSGTYLINQPLYLPNTNNIVISGGTLKASNNFNGYILNSNTNNRIGYSGFEYATENLTLENVFIDGSYKANGLYLNSYLRVKIISCTIHNFKEYGIYLGAGHEATILSTNLIGRTNGDNDLENTGIYIGSHDNIIDSCVIAYCQWAIDINETTNQICNSHFYCNRLNGGNIKMRTSFITFDNNYFDGSGLYATNPWHIVMNNNIFNITQNTQHIIKFDTDISGQVNINSIYITNSIIFDTRSDGEIIDFIECNFNPTNVVNCYIDKINKPTNININNPYNIFSFKNNDNPIIIPNTFFKASNVNHVIGLESTPDNFYEITYNANCIITNYVGDTSIYPWLFFKIYVPEKMRIVRNIINSNSDIDFYNENKEYIGSNKVTVEKGYYWVGLYRTTDLYLSTN